MNIAIDSVAMREQRVIAALSWTPDPRERLAELMHSHAQATAFPEEARVDQNVVPGCTAKVWLYCSWEGGRCRFAADANAPVVKALAGMLCELLDRAMPEEVLRYDLGIVGRLGLDRVLSPTRQNGLHHLLMRMKQFAARA